MDFRALAFLPILFASLSSGPPAESSGGSPARAAFARFRAMEGEWVGTSTRGWKEKISFRTIAGGSAVLESSFDAHPSETMATLWAMDGERLLLTHYCVSGTQPRLVATAFEDEGRTVTFTFLDGGNLPSRDRGHMDRVVYRFLSADRVESRWAWFQKGEERWMERIELERSGAR